MSDLFYAIAYLTFAIIVSWGMLRIRPYEKKIKAQKEVIDELTKYSSRLKKQKNEACDLMFDFLKTIRIYENERGQLRQDLDEAKRCADKLLDQVESYEVKGLEAMADSKIKLLHDTNHDSLSQ